MKYPGDESQLASAYGNAAVYYCKQALSIH